MSDVCSICGGSFHYLFPHDHKADNSGLDDGPWLPGRALSGDRA